MKNLMWVTGILFLLAVTAHAETVPGYYSSLKGTALLDLAKRAEFTFTGADATECERKEIGDMVFYHCQVKGSQVTVKTGGNTQTFAIDMLRARFVPTKEGTKMIYHFVGSYTDKESPKVTSKVFLHLYHYREYPNRVRGSLSLDDYGISAAIEASPSESELK